jgi:hypothetical protein
MHTSTSRSGQRRSAPSAPVCAGQHATWQHQHRLWLGSSKPCSRQDTSVKAVTGVGHARRSSRVATQAAGAGCALCHRRPHSLSASRRLLRPFLAGPGKLCACCVVVDPLLCLVAT